MEIVIRIGRHMLLDLVNQRTKASAQANLSLEILLKRKLLQRKLLLFLIRHPLMLPSKKKRRNTKIPRVRASLKTNLDFQQEVLDIWGLGLCTDKGKILENNRLSQVHPSKKHTI